MFEPISITLLLNGITLTLSLAFLILLLWHDPTRLTNFYFALFLFMMVAWSSGSLLSRGGAIAGAQEEYVQAGLRLMEFGFTSSALVLYLYVTILLGNRSLRFQGFAMLAVFLMLIYYTILYSSSTTLSYEIEPSGLLHYQFSLSSSLLFALINLAILIMVWQGFRKVRRTTLLFGIMLFSMGQFVALADTRLRILGVAEDAGSIAAIIMAFSLIQAQIIQPLIGKTRQIDIVRDVGLVITSRLRLQDVLRSIAVQSANLLNADASLIYLWRQESSEFVLAAQYNIHDDLLGYRLQSRQGLTGRVAAERRSALLNNYSREWRGLPDTPRAKEEFGSVIAAPLIFAEEVVGVLLVINNREHHLFEPEDVELMELLAPQAAVAMTNSRLFEQERSLTGELVSAKTQLEAVLSNTDNPVLAVDKKLKIIFANKATAELFSSGTTAEELHGKSLLDYVPRDRLPPRPRQLIKDLHRNRPHIYELQIEDRTYLCHVTRMKQDQQGWVAVLNDVSSLKELERLQQQMMEFTTHQLKNPLQGAMLHLDELEDLGEGILTGEMRYDIEVMREQMERMHRLIKGILNLERLFHTEALRLEPVDLTQLARAVVNDLKPLAESKSLILEFDVKDGLPIVIGDTQQLKEAVTCLIDNAIKYTLDHGQIKVQVSSDNGTASLKIQDSGIGIPAEAQARVFERFYRVEQPGTEQIGGSGLGLSLVKAIVDAHHGQITLTSEPQQGSTFYVTLPAISGQSSKDMP